MGIADTPPLDDDGLCFACGKNNPHGLGMRVSYDAADQSAWCRISLPGRFQGWAGIAHGGVVSTLLDEIMAHAVVQHVGQGMTTGMETRFRAPVPLETELLVRGWIHTLRSRQAQTQATVALAETGQVLAEAQAKFILRNSK